MAKFIGPAARRLGAARHAYLPELADDLARGAVSRRDFLRTSTMLGLSATAAAGMAGVVTAGRARAQSAPTDATLRIGAKVYPIGDPHTFSSAEHNQTRHVAEYLARTGADNVTRPWLAEGWDASGDLRIWTIRLRDGVSYNNGDPFDADAVAWNVRRWIDPETGSSNASLFGALPESGIEVVDRLTIRLNLERPELAIPENLAAYTTAMLHPSFVEEGGDFAANPVGTGPYRLVRQVVGEVCELERRDDYWGEAPTLRTLRYVDIGDGDNAKIAALASDQVDIVHELSADQVSFIEAMPDLVLYQAPTAQTAVARMQTQTAPFDDVLVRRAVAAATDNAEILEFAYRGYGQVGENCHVAPIHPEYAAMPTMRRDVERARALLAEAGVEAPLRVKIDYGQNEPWIGQFAQVMQQQLEPAGIELELSTMPQSLYWDIWKSTPFGITSWAHRPLGVQVLNLAYRSGESWNESGYANPAFDAALDEASGILDARERAAKMAELQTILQEDAVIIQPLWRNVFTAANARVQGFELHPQLYHQFDGVTLS